MQTAVAVLQPVMDRRIAFRRAILVAGMLLAGDRRPASSWLVAVGVQDNWDRFYDCLISVGKTSAKLATAVLGMVVQKLAPGACDRILLAIDDSLAKVHGRTNQGRCFECDRTFNTIELTMAIEGLDFVATIERLTPHLPRRRDG